MRERVNPPVQEGIERARERVANMMFPAVRRISQCIPHDQEEEATTWHDMEVRQHERAARKLNRSMRGKVNAPTQGGSKRARVSAANMILPDDWEEDAMTWHEKEEREHQWAKEVKQKLERKSWCTNLRKRMRESRANMTLPDNWEEEAMAWCEKEAREHERAAKKLNRSARGKSWHTDLRRKQESKRDHGKHDIARWLSGRNNEPTWEGSERAQESSKEVKQKHKRKSQYTDTTRKWKSERESAENMMLPDNWRKKQRSNEPM